MKKIWLVALLSLGLSARAQSYELSRLILDIEKLSELKSILKDLYQGYQILSTGYHTIKNLSQGSFNLHQTYLDGLLAVHPAIRKYQRVADIISYESNIISTCRSSAKQFSQTGRFDPGELDYLARVYDNLFNQSLVNIDNLLSILTAGALRMSDNERLTAIDGIYNHTREQWLFLKDFNSQASILGAQRGTEKLDLGTIGRYYGVK